MSCYEWEAGDIKLPSKEFVAFRKAMIKAHNDMHLDRHEKAKVAVDRLKQATKGRRKLSTWDYEQEGRRLGYGYEIIDIILKYDDNGKVKLVKPKKKDMPLLPISKNTSVHFEDAVVTFRDGNIVRWSVMENNHAREHAREHPLGRKFFNLLSRINWTRGTGGCLVGNDEYNRDSTDFGGGGNYITAAFGPLGKKQAGH